ncbi:MAG: response regulator [Candidatus Eremiobacteraeota bacterium]|nr:response regulator [Candidatus Eremiobacteraeota bacterium]
MANVLVVDDEPANRLLAATLLAHAGHTVWEASTVAEAIEFLERSPDVALVDLSLRDRSGAELIRTIRRECAGTEVVLYTATRVDGALRDFMEMHGIGFVVPKPCEPADLVKIVEEAVATR